MIFAILKPLPAVIEEQRGDSAVLAKGLRNCSTCHWLWVSSAEPVSVMCCHPSSAPMEGLSNWLESANDHSIDCTGYKMGYEERNRREKADAEQSPNPEP